MRKIKLKIKVKVDKIDCFDPDMINTIKQEFSSGVARIKHDAYKIFLENEKRNNVRLTDESRKFVETLKEKAGKEFKIKRRYGNRIVLQYPEIEIENNTKVIGIDLEKNLVEIL